MSKIFLALILCLSLTCCRYESDTVCDRSERMLPAKPDPETWAYTQEIIKIVNTLSAELEYYHQIWLENSYAIRGDDGHFYIWIDYQTQSLQDIPGARRMMVKLVTELLKRLNDSAFLATSQEGSPFTPDNLFLSIEYTSFYGVYVDPLYVGRAELAYGYLNVFYAHTAFEKNPVYYHKHSEPFETSEIIVATIIETDKRIRPDGEHTYDRLVSPVDWTSGKPDYDRKPQDTFDTELFQDRGTLTNYPKYADEKPSGALTPFDVQGGSPEQAPPADQGPPPGQGQPTDQGPPPDGGQYIPPPLYNYPRTGPLGVPRYGPVAPVAPVVPVVPYRGPLGPRAW